MAKYEGPDRQEYIQSLECFLTSLETKYGAEIPVDEASKILDKLDDDVRAGRSTEKTPA